MFGNSFFRLAFQRRFLLQTAASALAFVRVPGLVQEAALPDVSRFAPVPDQPDDGLTRIRAVSFGAGAAVALARVAMYPAPGLSFLRFESALALTGSGPKAITRALGGVHAVVLLVDENDSLQLAQAVALGRQAKSLGLLTIGVALAAANPADQAVHQTASGGLAGNVHSFMRLDGLPETGMSGHDIAVLRGLTHDLAFAWNEGYVGIDHEDVLSVLGEPSRLAVGCGAASGPDRARLAAQKALEKVWPEAKNRQRVRGFMVVIAGAPGSFNLSESREAMKAVHAGFSLQAICLYSVIEAPHAGDELHVTVLATAA